MQLMNRGNEDLKLKKKKLEATLKQLEEKF